MPRLHACVPRLQPRVPRLRACEPRLRPAPMCLQVRAALLEVVSEEDLPRFLGGKRHCPAACCPVHHALRLGDQPLDDEAEATLAAGAPPLPTPRGAAGAGRAVGEP